MGFMSIVSSLLAAPAAPPEMRAAGKSAFLIIDVQDCFLPGGSLAVPADHVLTNVNKIRASKSCLFDEVAFSQDFHPAGHISFASANGVDPFAHLSGKGGLPLTCVKPTSGNTADASCCPTMYVDPSKVNCEQQLCPKEGWSYDTDGESLVENNPACKECKDAPETCFETTQAMWPDHCLQDGDSGFPEELDKRDEDFVVQKGLNLYVDAYSAFMDNTHNLKTSLDDELQKRGVTTLYVAGIATDVCVKETVADALHELTGSYTVNVITDATAAVQGSQENFDAALEYMKDQGATLVTTAEVLAMECNEDDSVRVGVAFVYVMLGIAFMRQ